MEAGHIALPADPRIEGGSRAEGRSEGGMHGVG